MIYLTVDIQPAVARLTAINKAFLPVMRGRLYALAVDAENRAKDRMNLLVYNSAFRGSPRTNALRDSVYSNVNEIAGVFDIVLGASGGQGDKVYADFIEFGTKGSRITREGLLTTLISMTNPMDLKPYEQGRGGLEPRPSILPAVVDMSNRIPEAVEFTIRDIDPL